jgi:hypothetical protein
MTTESDPGSHGDGDETAVDAETAEVAGTPSSTKVRTASTVLIVLAAVIAVVSSLSTWVRAEMLDTDQWVEVSGDLLAEPQVQDALTTYLSNQLFERVDFQGQLEAALPEAATRLAGPLTGLLREPITNGISTVIASDRFAELWENVNRRAHERLVAILRDETRPGVSTADGTVTLEMATIITNVGERLGVPQSALDRIPPDAGEIVVFESDQLSSAQGVVRMLDFLSWFLFLAVAGMYAAAVYLARPLWRVALRNVGISLAVAGLTLLVLRALGVRAVVSAVVEDPRNEPLGSIVGTVATQMLGEQAWTGIVYGVLFALFAAVIGPHRWAVAVRRVLGRATESIGAAVAVAVIGILLLLWWSPGRSFDRLVTALVFVALAVAAIVSLLVVSRREYRTSGPG